jgi:hypothetical protein
MGQVGRLLLYENQDINSTPAASRIPDKHVYMLLRWKHEGRVLAGIAQAVEAAPKKYRAGFPPKMATTKD